MKSGLGFGFPVILVVLPLVITLFLYKDITPYPPTRQGKVEPVKLSTVFPLGIFMGCQSFLFFSILSWFASMVTEVPNPGMLILLMQIISLLPSFVMPKILIRTRRRALLSSSCAMLLALGFAILLFERSSFTILLSCLFLGLGSGSTMALGLTFTAIKGDSPSQTALISSKAQFIGYLMASLGPIALGYVYDKLNSWLPCIWMLLAVSVVMALVAVPVSRDR